MDSNNSDLKPGWLKELQIKSWEPEILLSGIVLYGMFQVPDILDRFLFYFSNEIYDEINAMDTLVALLKVGVYWLIGGLILHLICRGLWIGLVGLSYSFPEGINREKLKFQPKYMQKVDAVPSIEKIILKLERICSFIYSVAFLLFMSLVGTYIYASVLVIIPMITVVAVVDEAYLNEDLYSLLQTYGNWVLLIGLLGVIDFLSMGYFRRFRVLAILYWPFYRLFNFLTLANYYRPTYFTIVTNLNRWWLFLFLMAFTFISVVSSAMIRDSHSGEFFSRIDIWSDQLGVKAFEGNYQDNGSEQFSSVVQIPSDIIRDEVLRVFIPVKIGREDSIKKFMNFNSIADSVNRGQYYLEKTAEFYRLTIADSTFETKGYFQNVSSSRQKGYVTYLNIGFLEEGLHELKVEGPERMYKRPFAVVPFYKLD